MGSFQYQRIVQRHETDATGLLQSSNYFRYMEECECAFFRRLGLSFFKQNTNIVFPRVSTHCQVLRPITDGTQLIIIPFIKKLGTSSLTFEFTFFKNDHITNSPVIAEGEFSIVSCLYDELKGRLVSSPIEHEMKTILSGYLKHDKKPMLRSDLQC